jgi:NAD(P)-dependent dehydrogenase (short-subunit alcohol dehydrogenase family)
MRLLGKTVLITGAGRGIGAAAAREFAKSGANVVLAARSQNEIERISEEIGAQATAIRCDVSVFEDIQASVDLCVSHFGQLDILIGNAGVIEPISSLSESDPVDWGHGIDINLKGIFYGMRAALPVMKRAGGGTIITISSASAHTAVDAWSQYCASKVGAAMLTQCADLECRDKGVRALGLSPGTVATQMQEHIRDSGANYVSRLEWSDHIPATWVARALVWMCGTDADEFLGRDVSLRDENIRKRVGLCRR